jgi:hypothetical protein
MAQHGALDGWDSLPNPPSVVQVTVESGPRGRGIGAGPARLRALIAVSLIGAGLAAVVIAGGVGRGAPHSAHSGQATGVSIPISDATPRLRGAAQVAEVTEAYRFPLGCMGMTLTRQALAGALRSRTGPCWRYGVFVTAILRRVDGVWQLALEATSRSCPQIALPADVRAQLAVCRR